jgi:hypothetical protein
MRMRRENGDLDSVVRVQSLGEVCDEPRRMVAVESRIRRRDEGHSQPTNTPRRTDVGVGLRLGVRRHPTPL